MISELALCTQKPSPSRDEEDEEGSSGNGKVESFEETEKRMNWAKLNSKPVAGCLPNRSSDRVCSLSALCALRT